MATPVPDVFYDYEHFTLDRLVEILPVAQSHPLDDLIFTLLSLECFQDGILAHALTITEKPAIDRSSIQEHWEPPPIMRSSLVIADAVDDQGTIYEARMRSSSGGGRPDRRLSVRTAYCIAPALNPAATKLAMTLSLVEHEHYDHSGRPVRSAAEVIGGPWPVTFDLANTEKK